MSQSLDEAKIRKLFKDVMEAIASSPNYERTKQQLDRIHALLPEHKNEFKFVQNYDGAGALNANAGGYSQENSGQW